MRDLIVLAVILGSVPICLFNPYFGVLMWSWISYFNPHRYTWSVAYDFPVAQVIAIPTLIGCLFTRRLNRRFLTFEAALLLLLWIWFIVTLVHSGNVPAFADHYEAGKAQFSKVSKILLMTFLMILLVTTKERLRYVFLVPALSFGALAIKGALFGLVTAGSYRVYGPPDSFIADNNALGLALNMTLPIFFFMAREEKNRFLRMVLRVAFFSSIVAIILTYSRGALLGLAVVLAALAIKSGRKLISGVLLLTCAWMVLSFAPERWMDRMGNFLRGNLDESAQLRINAWEFAWELAKDYPATGGGFQTFTLDLFQRYTPHLVFAGAHSVYFQMLGEHGFVGLGLFLLLLLSCWMTLRRMRVQTQKVPGAGWVASYSHMLEIALLAYMITGAFLEFAYFDYFFQVVACTIILKILHAREAAMPSEVEKKAPLTTQVSEPAVP